MKLSVSLPEEDVAFVDAYAREQGAASRSAVIHAAVRLLRASELGADYAQAWDEWADGELWESAVGDGLSAAS